MPRAIPEDPSANAGKSAKRGLWVVSADIAPWLLDFGVLPACARPEIKKHNGAGDCRHRWVVQWT
jgi:hypothetical protein